MSRTLSVPLGMALLAIAVLLLPSCDHGGGARLCSINVTSTPGGATIVLDGTATGQTTPHLFHNLTPGAHTVRVSLSGYECDDPERERSIAAGDTWTVTFAFRLGDEAPTVSNLSVTPQTVPFTGGTVTIACQASDDGQVTAVRATISTPAGAVTRALSKPAGQWRCTWNAPANVTAQARTHNVQVIATDNDGATSQAATASFTVGPASSPPAAPW